MIGIMSVIAFLVGVTFGYLFVGKEKIGWLLGIFHTSSFSSKEGFYSLYDMADDELSFKLYKDHNKTIKKYADYLKVHADARSTAYKSFKHTNNLLKNILVFRVLPILLIPAIIFWSNWYYYLAGVAISVVYFIGYEIYKYGIRPGFYQRVIIFTILSGYYRDKSKADQQSS
jgi:hypothetical protein